MEKILFSTAICICFTMLDLQSQTFHWEADEAKGYDIPIGIGSWEEIITGDYYAEMEEYYNDYEVDVDVIDAIDHVELPVVDSADFRIEVYFGAWCGDSKEQLPYFKKIVEKSTLLQQAEMFYYGCDRDKKAGDIDISEAKIEYVPTFIFILNNKEIGRIVESPLETLELDILKILKDKE